MKRLYYFSNGKEQFGPLSFEELAKENINPNMLFWYEGLSNWKRGHELTELATIFKKVPPPISTINKNLNKDTLPPALNTLSSNDKSNQKSNSSSGLRNIFNLVITIGIAILFYNYGCSNDKNKQQGSAIVAQRYANDYVTKLLAKASPNAYNVVVEVESWNYEKDIYEIVMNCYWNEKETDCRLGFKISLNVDEDKIYGAKVLDKNDCGKSRELEIDFENFVKQGIIELLKEIIK
jgi:hypothetical protein